MYTKNLIKTPYYSPWFSAGVRSYELCFVFVFSSHVCRKIIGREADGTILKVREATVAPDPV